MVPYKVFLHVSDKMLWPIPDRSAIRRMMERDFIFMWMKMEKFEGIYNPVAIRIRGHSGVSHKFIISFFRRTLISNLLTSPSASSSLNPSPSSLMTGALNISLSSCRTCHSNSPLSQNPTSRCPSCSVQPFNDRSSNISEAISGSPVSSPNTYSDH